MIVLRLSEVLPLAADIKEASRSVFSLAGFSLVLSSTVWVLSSKSFS
jgi:hypothetical protein